MSNLIDDLMNMAGQEDPDERSAQAAVIDQCIDALVAEAKPDAALEARISELEGQLQSATEMRDKYRDRFVEMYMNAQGTKGQQPAPEPPAQPKVVRGVKDLCGWEI